MSTKRYQKRLFRFVTPMMLSAVLCITSPGFTQIPYLTKPLIVAQNQSGLSLEQQARSHIGSEDGIIRIKCGRNGKPFYVSSPNHNLKIILETFKETIGEGNFDFMISERPY